MIHKPFINRTLCDVLDEMRKCVKTSNYSYLPGLIEEAQSMGNRMEASFESKRDVDEYEKQKKELYKELKELEQQITKEKNK